MGISLAEVAGDPDFLLTRRGKRVVLEATIVAGGQDRGRLARIVQIQRAIDRIDHPDFRLWFHIDSEGGTSPSMRHARRSIERWLGGLDWAAERVKLESADGLHRLPDLTVETGGWRFLPRPCSRTRAAGTPGADRRGGPFGRWRLRPWGNAA